MVLIDGSRGEGGGGTLRTALTASALTQQPMRIDSIRGGTNFPGLDSEDLTLVQALARSVSAETAGAEVGSTTLSFLPTRSPSSLKGPLDLSEPSSSRNPNALVVLSALAPVLARSGMYSQVSLQGETYGHRALTFDYFANVVCPVLSKAGIGAFPDLEKAGFGRDASGFVRMDVEPSVIQGFDWSDRGALVGVRAIITTAGLPASVGLRGSTHLQNLASNARIGVEIEAVEAEGANSGAFVTVWAEYERGWGGAIAMGSRGLRVEALAQSTFEELMAFMQTSASVDPYLADQLLLPAVMAESPTIFRVSELTSRFLSSVSVIKQFLPVHVTVRGLEGQPGLVSIRR